MMKKFTTGLFIGLALALGTAVLAAPASTIMRNILPETDNIYELGTTSARWLRIYTQNASTSNLTVSLLNSADCDVKASVNGVFSCGTDAGGGLVFNPFTAASFVASSTATSTIASGIYANFISAPRFEATSTVASSTFRGDVDIADQLQVTGISATAGSITNLTVGSCTGCGGGFDFTATSDGSATTTTLVLSAGALISTSTIGNLVATSTFSMLGTGTSTFSGGISAVGLKLTNPLHIVALSTEKAIRIEENSGGEFMEIVMNSIGDMEFIADDGTSRLKISDANSGVSVPILYSMNTAGGVDSDTFIDLSAAADAITIEAGGVNFFEFTEGVSQDSMVINNASADIDFRWESDVYDNALFFQGSNGFLGIGTSSPYARLSVAGDLVAGSVMATSTFYLPVSATSTITTSGEAEIDTTDNAIHFNSGGTTYSLTATGSVTFVIASSTTGSESAFAVVPFNLTVRRVWSMNSVLTGLGTTSLATTTGHDFQVWHGTRGAPISLFTTTKNTVSTSTFTEHTATFNDNSLLLNNLIWVKDHNASSSLHDMIIQVEYTRDP